MIVLEAAPKIVCHTSPVFNMLYGIKYSGNRCNTVDIEAVEKNTPDETLGDEKIPNEEKKGKSSKKINTMLDARHRLEDLHDAKRIRDSLDYLYITEKEKDDVIF